MPWFWIAESPSNCGSLLAQQKRGITYTLAKCVDSDTEMNMSMDISNHITPFKYLVMLLCVWREYNIIMIFFSNNPETPLFFSFSSLLPYPVHHLIQEAVEEEVDCYAKHTSSVCMVFICMIVERESGADLCVINFLTRLPEVLSVIS